MERPEDRDANALSRRAVLRGLGALAAGSALAACAPGGSKASPSPSLERARLTSIVVRKPGSVPNPKLPIGTDTLPQIEHIVVLMMENHSFDDHFGMLKRGDGFKLGSDGLPLDANPYTDGKPAQGVPHAVDVSAPQRARAKPGTRATRPTTTGATTDS